MKTFMLAVLLSACTSKAPPMDGTCAAIDVDNYEAAALISPTMRCAWRARLWDCTDHQALLGDYWSCEAVGPKPAEAMRP